jgi:hypothetical protein
MGDATPPKEHLLVVLPLPPNQELLDGIKKKHPGITIKYHVVQFGVAFGHVPHDIPDGTCHPYISPYFTADNSTEDFLEATILVTLGAISADVKLLKNIKLIHLFSAGADRLVNTPVWNETKIPITNSSGVHGPQISEWVILQMLSNNHKQKTLLEWQQKHYWGKHTELGFIKDYVGQRLGVLGYGAIGRQSKLIPSIG